MLTRRPSRTSPVPAVVEHLESVVSQIEPAPILMGHSAGGVFMQLLMDRGYGAAGVAINSAPTEGVKRVPLSQIRSSFPVLKNPANRHKAVGFTFEQWRYVFTNTFSEEEARRLYERYHIPASGRVFWGSALANIHPGPDEDWKGDPVQVDLGRLPRRNCSDDRRTERCRSRDGDHHPRRSLPGPVAGRSDGAGADRPQDELRRLPPRDERPRQPSPAQLVRRSRWWHRPPLGSRPADSP